jgi:cellulose synthase (UDP-forming)
MGVDTGRSVTYAARQLEKQLTSPVATLILICATLGAIIYFLFLLQPGYRGDTLPYILVLVAEFFIICHGLISFWTILSGRFNPRDFGFHHTQTSLFGKNTRAMVKELEHERNTETLRALKPRIHNKVVGVDVFITVYGEPLDVVGQTAVAARDMHGAHKTYILDDGKSDEVEAYARQIGVNYIRRAQNIHAKAGNINHALSVTKGDYFIILDADFVPHPRFIYETLPFFDDDNLAFVQAPQYYSNQNNFVSTAASFMQHVFYSLVQSGKNRFNAAFCVGTNVVFRRIAVESVGGIYQKSKSEDIWTSLLLHENGFRSIYINKVLAIGKTPETIKAYSKQQLRWATGSFEILIRHNPLFSRKLTADQRLQYFGTTTFYFSGFAVAVLLLLPILQIFFNLTPIALDIPLWQWAALYSGFYVSQIFLSMYTMGGLKIETLMLAAASFPIYIKAFFNAALRREQAWQATNSIKSFDSPFNYIRIQTYIFVFLLVTTAVGFWKSLYTSEFSVSLAWCALNTFIIGYFVFVAIKESRRARLESKSRRKITAANQPLKTTEGAYY